MSRIITFLERILPATGWLCAADLTNRKHVWAQNPEELAKKILAMDTLGAATYHACASFTVPSNRTKPNVHRLKCFWMDIDVGPVKYYKTYEQAVDVTEQFCTATSLPPPMYVKSGNGLHLYWPLREEIDRETWEEHAKALKKLCKDKSFWADPARTSDASSVLRPPQTFNRKDPSNPKEVIWTGDVEPYPLHSFPKIQSKAAPSQKLTQALTSFESAPADPNQMAELCGQIRQFRNTQGAMPEPDWKACLGAVAFCDDGVRIAHAWSKGDERYNEVQTEEKIRACLSMTGPTTCAHFQDLNDICSVCPFKGTITTPVELGRGAPKLTPAQIEFVKELGTEVEIPTVGLFRHIAGSLVFTTENKEGKEVHVRITQYPVIVDAVMKGELTSDSYSVVLKFKTPHEPWQLTTIPVKSLFGAAGISEIMGKGIVIHHPDLFRQYVRESMDHLNAQQKAALQYEQFGWKDNETAFLVGSRLYTKDGYRMCSGGREVSRRSMGMGPAPEASLAIWKDCVNKLFAPGFEGQSIAVLASFAAPFMRWQSNSEGGAILSLVSRAGGTGKTTALTAAASVWGKLEAMSQITADTKVAKGIGLGIMGNLPMIRDEYTQRDPEILRDEVEVFTAGRDKQRGTSDGGLINLGPGWQTIMIAGSNNSLVDILMAGKNGHAMSGRVVEFMVDIPKNVAHWKGDKLKETIAANSGVAGEMFIRSILQDETLSYLKGLLPKVREDMIVKHGLTSDKRFIVRTLSGIAVAGHVVRELGLIDFSIDRIMEWAQDTLFGHVAIYSISANIERSIHVLSRFLSEHFNNTLVMPDSSRGKVKQNPIHRPTRALCVRHEMKSGKMFVDRATLRRWLQREQYPWNNFIQDLVDIGVVTSAERPFNLGAGSDMSVGMCLCLEIDAYHPDFHGGVRDISKPNERIA